MASHADDRIGSTTIPSVGPHDVEEDYVNPAEKSPRWLLSAHAFALRTAASLAFKLTNSSDPAAPSATETIWLDSTLGQWQGEQKISVDIWMPAQDSGDPERKGRRPAIINFHGGGFILGQGTDDSRWAGTLTGGLDAVVFSVNYRLAPGYSFPTPVEDCVEAVVKILDVAEKYSVDTSQVILSGFSAGGTLALSSWAVLQDPKRWEYKLPHPAPQIAGIVLYYPLLDWTIDRPRKRLTCPRPDLTLPSTLTDLIDASYLHPVLPRRERDDQRLSPGLMPDAILDRLPPVHLCLCEYDMLLAEGQAFAQRARARGKSINVRVVGGEKHAWDKPPPMAPKESVEVEYGEAVEAIKAWLDSRE
ncbi:hypothetical protein AAE478_000691 [Parahypoxylon ruwenzoriense]